MKSMRLTTKKKGNYRRPDPINYDNLVVGNPNKPKNTTTYKEAHTPKKLPKKENDKMYNLIK